MLPGVELARRRRVHYHGDVAHRPGWGPAEHHHPAPPTAPPLTGVVGPALAARIRLEEKLRGPSPPAAAPSPPSRWSRLMRDGRENSRQQQQQQETVATSIEQRPTAVNLKTSTSRAELKRTLSRVDLCAVCLEEVQAKQRITRLPCSHKYHSDCVLPWLAMHPDCPCCRTLVPSVNTLS